MKPEVQPFITVPFVLPHRIELAKGAKVSVRSKIDGQDYYHALTIESRRVGQLAAKLVGPAGDRFDLIFDQDKGTASLLDPLPMPAAWAATLTKRLGEIAVTLLGQIAVTTRKRRSTGRKFLANLRLAIGQTDQATCSSVEGSTRR